MIIVIILLISLQNQSFNKQIVVKKVFNLIQINSIKLIDINFKNYHRELAISRDIKIKLKISLVTIKDISL